MLGGRVKMKLHELVPVAIELRRDAPPEVELHGVSEILYLVWTISNTEMDSVAPVFGLAGKDVHRGLEQSMLQSG
jgi:hypothetical protein